MKMLLECERLRLLLDIRFREALRMVVGIRPKTLKMFVASACVLLSLICETATAQIVSGAPVIADFADALIYEIGEVPFLTAWEGQDVKIRVRATALGAGTPVEASFVQPPSGLITHTNGDFFYRAGPLDKGEFTVRFHARNSAGGAVEQTIFVQPIPLLPPESDLLGVERKGVSDPASRDYLVISDLKEPKLLFNYQQRVTRVLTISGKTVVLQAGHANRLHDSYHGNEDVRELHINAERLIIASPIRFPGTTVRIRARTLEFQDSGGVVSTLSTESVALLTAPTDTDIPGQAGLRGGDIEVFAETLVLPNGTEPLATRFVPKGGAGQDAAPGRKGTDGKHLKPVDVGHFTANNPDNEVSTAIRRATTGMALDSDRNDKYDVYAGQVSGTELTLADDVSLSTVNATYVDGGAWRSSGAAGNGRWKPDGEDAVPGGASGDGGKGGTILSNLERILPLASRSGGPPGKSEGYPGGVAGTPITSYFYRAQDVIVFLREERRFYRLDTHLAQPGRDAFANQGSFGPESTAVLTNANFAWLTAPSLRQVLAHTKDAYLDGEVEFVAGVATDYLPKLAEFRQSAAFATVAANSQLDLSQIEEELQLLAHRTTAGLDYFGNPPGWVPLLSLEANKLAFEQEINRAINILYLEYWLTDATRGLQAKVGALTDARVQLADESDRLAKDFETANTLLPQLTVRVNQLDADTKAIHTSLEFLEKTLLNRAKDNVEDRNKGPMWRRVARGLGTLCKFVPIPWVQAVGVGLDIAASFNAQKPWESLDGVADLVTTYRGGGFEDAANEVQAGYKKIRFPDLPNSADPEAINGYLKDLRKASGPLVAKVQKVQQAMRGTQAPRTQIEAELAKLKAESKDFRGLTDQVSKLLAEKEAFALQVSQTMQALGRMSEHVTANLLAMDAFNVNYAQAAGALDDRAVMYLKEVGRRARERLLLYHYYVKKAYEYRLLKPYPTRLNLQNLFDRFRTIGETAAQQEGTNTFHRLSAAEFGQLRGIYDDALGELVREVVVEYNRNAPPQLAPRLLGLSADEVSLLNQGKPVALDLRTVGGGLFTAGEENVRIVNLRVKQLEYEPRGAAIPSDELTLRISHGGESTIWTSAGDRPRAYQFVHYTEATERPVQWGARLFPWNGELTQIVRSPSADSLLGALLNQSGNDPQKGGFFTYLGGLCTLNLSLETRGAGLRLKNAVLEIHYEHVQRRSSLRSLEFSTSDGLPAYIELARTDLGGRGDGLGNFRREFTAGSEVTFSAPDRVGNLRFDGFVEDSPNPLAAGVARAGLHAIGNHREPSETSLPASTDGKRHSVTLILNQNRKIEARYVPVAHLELRIGKPATTGEVPLWLDGERYTPYQLEEGESVAGPWKSVDGGLLLEPKSFSTDSTLKSERFFRAVQKP